MNLREGVAIRIYISSSDLNLFVEIQKDTNYQHLYEEMNLLGKRPIVPAFQLLSKIFIETIPYKLIDKKKVTIEGFFNTILTVEENAYFNCLTEEEDSFFVWDNKEAFGKHLDFDASIEIKILLNQYYRHKVITSDQKKKINIDKVQTEKFAKLFGLSSRTNLSDLCFIASYSTFVIVLETKNKMSRDNKATPFYKYIRISFNKGISGISKSQTVTYEYDLHFVGKRTIYFFFRVTDENKELLNGELKVDFISKKNLLRFTKNY